jgi:glycosyltransferase involved in cell wall biosynthesis
MPSVSVIVPVFNGEKTIKETVLSVLRQSFSDFELIVVNDGSVDSTLNILLGFSDCRLKIFSYPNSGLPASRNKGIMHASGEYVSFLDADDLWKKEKLQAQLRMLQLYPEATVAYSWTDWIDESGNFLRHGSHIGVSGNVYNQLLLRDFIESGSNPLIHRKAFEKVGGFDETLTNAHDWDMWLRLAAHFTFVPVPAPHILYRISPNSMSSNVWKMETSSLQVIEKAFSQASNPLKVTKREVLANRYKYLTFKALEGRPEARRGLAALRFYGQVLRYDPAWLKRPRLQLLILSKIAIATLLPTQIAQGLQQVLKRWKTNHN